MSWASYLGTMTCPECDVRFGTVRQFDEHLITKHHYERLNRKGQTTMTDKLANTATPTDLALLSSIAAVADRPNSLDPNDRTGTEDIGRDDLRLPRLAIAQGLSNQLIPDDSSYIDGLKLFDLFNDLSGQVYGKGPLTFVPVRRDVRRIEFVPREQGGGILDLDVPPTDARNSWTVENGVRTPPRATKFVEFVALLLRPGAAPEPIVISIKDTNKFNRRASEQLTAFIKFRSAPIYAGLYTVAVKSEKNDSGTFGVFVMKNAGWIPKDTPAGAALYAFAEDFAKSLEGKQITVNREPGADDFDPAAMEAEKAGATTDM